MTHHADAAMSLPTDGMTIGQLARSAGVGVETVRFYERRGLLDEPPRRSSGYRSYPAEASAKLRFIRRAKELGFSLEEIGDLLTLRSHPSESRPQVQERARAKIDDIERRLSDLERMRDVLVDLLEACEQRVESDGCPILEALESDADPGDDP